MQTRDSKHHDQEKRRQWPLRLRRSRSRVAREGAARHHDLARDAARRTALLRVEAALRLDRRQPEPAPRRAPRGWTGRGVEGIREPAPADAVPAERRGAAAIPRLPGGTRAGPSRRDAEGRPARPAPAGPAEGLAACLTITELQTAD